MTEDEFDNMTEDEFDKLIQQALEDEARIGDGFRAFENYLSGPYKEQWHQVWQEGRAANVQGQSREDNPHKLKVWRAVWEYGWDNYDPNKPPSEFTEVEDYLKSLPTRPMTEDDLA